MKRSAAKTGISEPSVIRYASAVHAPPSLVPTTLELLLFEFLMLILLLGGMFGCLITGFSIPVSPSAFYLCLSAMSIVLPFCGRLSKGLPFLFLELLCSAFGALYLWWRQEVLKDGLFYLSAAVLRYLCRGFPGLKMPDMLAEHEQFLLHAETNTILLSSIRSPITETLIVLAFIVGMLWVLLYQRLHKVWISAALPLPAFVLCFLIIETTIPALWALLLILLYWALLLLTRSAALLHTRAASAQALFLLIPCMLFLSAVYLWYPRQVSVGVLVQNGYDTVLHTLSKLETSVSNAAENLFSAEWLTVSAEGSEISFQNLGPRRFSGRTVMRIKGDTTGVVYLRENTYTEYSSDGWKQTDMTYPDIQSTNPAYATFSAEVLAESGVSPSRLSLDGARSDLLFSPYYFAGASVLYTADGDSRILNALRSPDYEVEYYRFSGDFDSLKSISYASALDIDMREYQTFMLASTYCEIDDTIAKELRRILSENNISTDSVNTTFSFEGGTLATVTDYDAMWDRVADITHFVRKSAEYSLDAERNSTDREFVLWFLEDAEYGYCTHFATAEVMLLRACGIPARLAAGYLGSIRTADKWTAIKDSNAHAWAEVYDNRIGWIPIEATPPGAITDEINNDDIIVGIPPTTEELTTDTEAVTEPDLQTEPVDTEDLTNSPSVSPAPNDPASQGTPGASTDTAAASEKHGIGIGSGSGTLSLAHLLRTAAVILGGLIGFAAILLLPIQIRTFRLKKLHALFTPAEEYRNAAVLRLYRRCTALARACREEIPSELTVLAEKARFSNHILSQEELDCFIVWYRSRCEQLKENDSPLQRLRHFWIDLYD